MNDQALLNDIRNARFKPLYFFHGEEVFFIDRLTNAIEKHALTEAEKAFNQAILYGKEVDAKAVIDYARQYPMMASRRVVIVKEAQEMRTLPNLITYVEKPSDQTVLVLAYKHKKLDQRTKFAKALKEKAIVFEAKRMRDYQMAQWIAEYVKAQGRSIQAAAAALIAEYVGTDLSKVANELDKLILNVAEGQEVTPQDIQDQIGISKDYNIFELQRALGQKDVEKVHRIIQHFASNLRRNPLVVVNTMLFNYFSKVFVAQAQSDLNDQALAKVLRLPNPYFVRDYRSAAKRYSRAKLERIFGYLFEVDRRSKGIENRSVSDASLLRELSLRILE